MKQVCRRQNWANIIFISIINIIVIVIVIKVITKQCRSKKQEANLLISYKLFLILSFFYHQLIPGHLFFRCDICAVIIERWLWRTGRAEVVNADTLVLSLAWMDVVLLMALEYMACMSFRRVWHEEAWRQSREKVSSYEICFLFVAKI